jgi:hypothetical protein
VLCKPPQARSPDIENATQLFLILFSVGPVLSLRVRKILIEKPTVRRCIFCTSTPLTQEHIFAQWIVAMFPQGEYDQGWGMQDRVMKHWTKPNMESTVGCVCEPCNNGWMSEIENNTKQILKHLIAPKDSQPVKLSRRNQLMLARWASLRAFVLAKGAPPGVDALLTESDSLSFAEYKSVLSDMCIWLAWTPSAFRPGATVDIRSRYDDAAKTRGVHCQTYFIGEVTFQVFLWKGFPGDP